MMFVAERLVRRAIRESQINHEERSYRGLGYQSNLGKTLDCGVRRLNSVRLGGSSNCSCAGDGAARIVDFHHPKFGTPVEIRFK